MRDALRVKHLALATEQSYVGWLVRFSRFVSDRCPTGSPEQKMEAFLTQLAKQDVSASTQNGAFCAIYFLEALPHNMRYETSIIGNEIRETNSGQKRLVGKSEPNAVDMQMRMWGGEKCNDAKPFGGAGKKLWQGDLSPKCKTRTPKLARISCLDLHEAKMFEQKLPRVQSLGRQRNHHLRRLEGKFSIIHGLCWEKADAKTLFRSNRFKRKLRTKKRKVGYFRNAAKQQAHQQSNPISRGDAFSITMGFKVRCASQHDSSQAEKRMACRKSNNRPASLVPTHCLNAGQNPRAIQQAMGHSQLETTMGYLHAEAMSVKSPLEYQTA